ncbi:MAG: tRNA guanosine(34) transglycosylase Tgt [Actinomycetota bacterium]
MQVADGAARAGVLSTSHGEVATPGYMPVGTRAAVRGVDVDDLEMVGAKIVLANAYHLMLRPGTDIVERLGGIHNFWGWEGPILTDSGGYQIFSLKPEIDDEAARFRSVYDGSVHSLSPEQAVTIQERLGPDIAMALDVCIGLPAPRQAVASAMERTLQWAERSLRSHRRSDQALFGIIQGGVDPDLRAESAARTARLGFVGFGIGGLSVGETSEERITSLEAVMGELPAGKVRYVMGLGDPAGVLDAVGRGADLFDCVWPTRLARHGRVLTAVGDFNLRRAEFQDDERPLEPGCMCGACRRHQRGYLRHLLVTNELSAFRIISVHNLTYTLGLLAEARKAIENGRFRQFVDETLTQRALSEWRKDR